MFQGCQIKNLIMNINYGFKEAYSHNFIDPPQIIILIRI